MNFEEWLESKRYMDGYGTDYQDAYDEGFDEGAKSQQAKIDILQIKLNGADERAAAVLNHKNKMIDELQAKIDELQARVDEALYAADESCGVSVAAFVKLNNILKGNKDEN